MLRIFLHIQSIALYCKTVIPIVVSIKWITYFTVHGIESDHNFIQIMNFLKSIISTIIDHEVTFVIVYLYISWSGLQPMYESDYRTRNINNRGYYYYYYFHYVIIRRFLIWYLVSFLWCCAVFLRRKVLKNLPQITWEERKISVAICVHQQKPKRVSKELEKQSRFDVLSFEGSFFAQLS